MCVHMCLRFYCPCAKQRDSQVLQNVRREVALMKKLVHPNVVRLLEVIDDPQNDLLFMVGFYLFPPTCILCSSRHSLPLLYPFPPWFALHLVILWRYCSSLLLGQCPSFVKRRLSMHFPHLVSLSLSSTHLPSHILFFRNGRINKTTPAQLIFWGFIRVGS